MLVGMLLLAAANGVSAADPGAGQPPKLARTPDAMETWYYRFSMGERDFGYGSMSLLPIKIAQSVRVTTGHGADGGKATQEHSEEQTVYTLTAEMSAALPDGQRIHGQVHATLSPAFEPQSVEMTRTVKSPDGAVVLSAQAMAEVAADNVVLTTVTNGAKETRKVARPAVPVVFGVEVFVECCDPKTLPGAVIHELNPETGEAIELRAEVTSKDGAREVRLTKPDGTVAYLLELGADGKLTRWSEGPNAPAAVRITKEEYEKLASADKK